MDNISNTVTVHRLVCNNSDPISSGFLCISQDVNRVSPIEKYAWPGLFISYIQKIWMSSLAIPLQILNSTAVSNIVVTFHIAILFICTSHGFCRMTTWEVPSSSCNPSPAACWAPRLIICEGTSNCHAYYGIRGIWQVLEISAGTLKAFFILMSLTIFVHPHLGPISSHKDNRLPYLMPLLHIVKVLVELRWIACSGSHCIYWHLVGDCLFNTLTNN